MPLVLLDLSARPTVTISGLVRQSQFLCVENVKMTQILTPQLIVGQRWTCRTSTHRGQNVELVAIKSRTVRLMPTGAWSRAQRSNFWTIPVARFLATYVPLRAS
jgi:hypothetical protein